MCSVDFPLYNKHFTAKLHQDKDEKDPDEDLTETKAVCLMQKEMKLFSPIRGLSQIEKCATVNYYEDRLDKSSERQHEAGSKGPSRWVRDEMKVKGKKG